MKLAFVHVGWESLGLEILSSLLLKEFPQVEQKLFFHYDLCWDPADKGKTDKIRRKLILEMKQYRPDICCFSAYTDTCHILEGIAADIKMFSAETVNIFGGIHATLLKAELLEKNRGIDIVVIGEAEGTFKELIAELVEGTRDWAKIKGIAYRQGERIISNPLRLDLPPLDEIPFPNKDLFAKHLPAVSLNYLIMSGRGCPHHCTYCISHYLNILYGPGRYMRRRSVKNTIDELELIKKRSKWIVFMDDVFLYSTEFIKEFLPVYKEKIGLPFYCYTSPLFCDEERVELLKAAGCRRIGLGIQSGSERIRYDYFKRKGSNRDIVRAANLIKSKGIKCSADIILGSFCESGEDIQKTLELLCEIQPELVQVFYLSYYPGLEITDMALSESYISRDEYSRIKSGTFQKSFYTGSTLKGRVLKDARRAGLMCLLITILPKRLCRWLIKKRLYLLFPSGFVWHSIGYALSALRDRQRVYFIWQQIRAESKKLFRLFNYSQDPHLSRLR